MSDSSLTIYIQPERLSDGSIGHSVFLETGGEDFPCMSKKDATAFAETLREAINKHTVHLATVETLTL